MIDQSKKISLLISRLIPPFIIDEYPQFTKFIKTFLEYIEREKGEYDIVANLLNYNDVDNTLEEFEYLFKEAFAKTFPLSISNDVALLVKNVRDFYKSKGTESSYKFLFETLFKSSIEIKYPKFNILKASDGIWYTPEFLLLTDSNDNIPAQFNGEDYDVSGIIGRHIIGSRTGAEAYVVGTDSKTYQSNLETFIEIAEIEGTFEPSEMLIITENFVYNGSFTNLGAGWAQSDGNNDAYIAETGRFTILQPLGVESIERYIYQKLDINELGVYKLRYSIYDCNENETISIRIGYEKGLYDILHVTIPSGTTFPYRGFVEIPSFNVTNDIYISLFSNQSATKFVTFDEISISKEDDVFPFLFIAPESDSIQNEPARWADNRGFLSDEMYLQDNYYYQDYSYVIVSSLKKEDFETVVKDNVHPAGYIMFNESDVPAEYIFGVESLLSSNFGNDSWLNYGYESLINSSISSVINFNDRFDLSYEISSVEFGITYAFVEANRENELVNSSWNTISTFDAVKVADFETDPTKIFIYRNSFDVVIEQT